MRIHHSEHLSNFVILPNELAQHAQLGLLARGLLTDLLSRRDGHPETARDIAKRCGIGRGSLQKAFGELIAAGYYWVEKIRRPDGTITSVAHVYDAPRTATSTARQPLALRPAAGDPAPGGRGALSKNQGKEPSLPAPRPARRRPTADRTTGAGTAFARTRRSSQAEPPTTLAPEALDTGSLAAVDILIRVLRPEPRLRLTRSEAGKLAPLVTQWLERGSTTADLGQALLPGLPAVVHSAEALVRNRLERKKPPAAEPLAAGTAQAPKPRYSECVKCHDPVPTPGICRPCAGLPAPARTAPGTVASGPSRARQAFEAARAAFVRPAIAPALHRPA